MNLCADGHKEVCYEERDCPVCDKIKEIIDFEDEIFALKEKIETLENQQKSNE